MGTRLSEKSLGYDQDLDATGRILFVMHDFHGWTAGAAWEAFKFDLKHFSHIARLAIVGETNWEKGMSVCCRPYTTAKIKYFHHADITKARKWIQARGHIWDGKVHEQTHKCPEKRQTESSPCGRDVGVHEAFLFVLSEAGYRGAAR